MKRTILFFLFFICCIGVFAQKEAAIWYFGRNAGVDFNSGTPVALTNGALNTLEGCATISDTNGNLLLYTDGITVWNRNHQPMPNGTDLLGDPSSTQSGLIVPKPGEPNIYYIFSLDDEAEVNGLRYTVVDMNLDGGLGDVTAEKNLLLRTPMTEKITAVENADGSGIWVITKAYDTNEFLSYLVDASGLNTMPVVSSFSTTGIFPYSSIGSMKVSSDGRKLAVAYSGGGRIELHHFDAATGRVYDLVSLQGYFSSTYDSTQTYSVEFSNNGQILYATTRNGVYQFDISTFERNAIMASGLLLSQEYRRPDYPFSIQPGQLQMAIDGKIYCPLLGRAFLMVINHPDVLDVGCDFVENGVPLNGRINSLGLPPFIQSYFLVGFTAENLCLGATTQFNINSGEPVLSIFWDFGDGNTSILENPIHTYGSAGTYSVSATVTTATKTKTETKDIIISEAPIANSIANFEECSTSQIQEFDLSTKDTELLGGQSGADFNIAYYSSLVDAQNNANALPILYTNTNTAETITARISNINNPSCYDTTSFDLILKTAPVLNPTTDWIVCDTDSDSFYDFDLTQKDTEILSGQSTTAFTISYHETLADAQNDLNELVSPYNNTTSSEQLFFRIENTAHPECFETGNFDIEVITAVNANTPTNMELCDNNNDGIFSFDLTVQGGFILNGQSVSSFTVSYHSSQMDADNGTATLNPTNYTNRTPYFQTIFARVQNNANSDCYATTYFDIIVNDSPVFKTVADWKVCDDDNDGFHFFDLNEKDSDILGGQSAADFRITYYETQTDADTNTNNIVGSIQNTSNPQTLFYRIENGTNTNCFKTGSFVLEVFETPTAGTPLPIIACDENETGVRTFDLSVKDSEVLNGLDTNSFVVSYFSAQSDANNNQNSLPKEAYTNSQIRETVYARVHNKNNGACFDTAEFEISINPLPQPNLDETYVICPDSPELTIDGGDSESWSWRDENGAELGNGRTLNITALGDYTLTVTLTSNGVACEKTVPFEVVSSGAPEDFTTEIGDPSDNVTITVDATGTGEFEYSVDGENYQDSNRLEVFPGEHTVYVRDKFLCRTVTKQVIALGYQKFFTPNGDGFNENWNIIGAYHYPESKLYVYDRYGKLLQQISPMTAGWDGSYNGLPLPESDYWFRYIFDGGKVFTGHFSLKR